MTENQPNSFSFASVKYCTYICSMQARDITSKLKTRRKELKLTLQDVADLTGETKQYINIIENGANTKLDKLIKLAKALNLTVTLSENITYKPD